jgi:Flp pilus assembly pilin Flp
MMSKLKQLGQGMTEYIIIVALIAIAAIAVYGFFGDAIRGQVGAMTQELAGKPANMGAVETAEGAAASEATRQGGLSNYGGN